MAKRDRDHFQGKLDNRQRQRKIREGKPDGVSDGPAVPLPTVTRRLERPVRGMPSDKVTDYRYDETKRPNNPPAGMATYDTLRSPSQKYSYDPHLDPQLIWTGKAGLKSIEWEQDKTSFEVDTISLHIHERVSTQAILKAVSRRDVQRTLFEDPELPLADRIEFYQHEMNWANRLVLGDSLLVMNSLLKREGFAGKVQMIYIDPPYGIAYRSNFQSTSRKHDVKEDDKSLTREPEQIKAYRDTWELGVHSYLTYLRDRLLLSRELLADSGSVFVQIGDENLHHVRELMDEVFGHSNFVSIITIRKTTGEETQRLGGTTDFLLFYAKDSSQLKFWPLYRERSDIAEERYDQILLLNGESRPATQEERAGNLPKGARLFRLDNLTSSRPAGEGDVRDFEFEGKHYSPGAGTFKTNLQGLKKLARENRLQTTGGGGLRYRRFADDFRYARIGNLWSDISGAVMSRSDPKIYAVQTSTSVIQRCMLMTTDPGDLVFDPTCGSGTTAVVAENWGRRWVTCDTSRVALSLARQRILTASYPYFELSHPEAGVSGGFRYPSVERTTLGSIAQDERPEIIELRDAPVVAREVVRVSGPFTVEAVVAPSDGHQVEARGQESAVGPVSDVAGNHVQRLFEELRKAAEISFPGNRKLPLTNVRRVYSGVLHADAEAVEAGGTIRVAFCFGPAYGPVTARQVEEGVRAAQWEYQLLVFAGFAFDAEASAFIQKNPHPHLRVRLVYVTPDVMLNPPGETGLLRTTRGSQVFTSFGEPDIEVKTRGDRFVVALRGVDVYDPNSGEVSQTDGSEVAAWFLDQDYDGQTFLVCQAFFPRDGANPWERLGRALHGLVDESKFDSLRGTESQPFVTGLNRAIAVKVIDFRGNEVIKVHKLPVK